MAFLLIAVGKQLGAEESRYSMYSLRTYSEIKPGFTSDPRQILTLDMATIGREPIVLKAIRINERELSLSEWSTRLHQLRIHPGQNLRIGLNRIVIRYEHPAPKRVDQQGNLLEKLEGADPIEHTFWVNHQVRGTVVQTGKRGDLIVDGQPKLILGSYRSGREDRHVEGLGQIAEADFNLVHDYRYEGRRFVSDGKVDAQAFIDDARHYLQAAHRHGLGVFMGLPRVAVDHFAEEELATIVSELSNEPALWLWYLRDEPSLKSVEPKYLSRTYQLIKRLDPNHPVVLLVNRIEWLDTYHAFGDIIWFDRYPIIATADHLISLSSIVASMRRVRQTVDSNRPVWQVTQIHDNKGLPNLRRKVPTLPEVTDANHRPTEAEMRAQTHLAFAMDLKAVVYYWAPHTWYSMERDTPGTWESFVKVLQETRGLADVLMSEEPVPEIEVHGGHDKVLMWQRRHAGKIYVGVVNASVLTGAELRLKPAWTQEKPAYVLGDAAYEHDSSGGVNITLGGAGVLVLSFPAE